MKINILKLFIALVIVLGLVSNVQAQTTEYYVDPATGSDTNPGTRTAPWKTIPGTYRNDDAGYLSTAWGPAGDPIVSSTKKIPKGTVIWVKSGSTIRNRIRINSDFYAQDANAQSPIILARRADWGSGSVIIDGSDAQTLQNYYSLVEVDKIPYFQIDGSGGITTDSVTGKSYDGFIVQNGGIKDLAENLAVYGVALYGRADANGNPLTPGYRLSYVRVYNTQSHLFVVESAADFSIDHCEADGSGPLDVENSPIMMPSGFHIGGSGYGSDRGLITDCYAHDLGATPGAGAGGTDSRIGFWTTDSHDLTFNDCEARDNEGDGFDNGSVSDVRLDNNIVFNRCLAINCDDGFACNVANTTGSSTFYFNSCVSSHNNIGFDIYRGPEAYVFNSTIALNKLGVYINAPAIDDVRFTKVTLKNNLFYGNRQPDEHRGGDLVTQSVSHLTLVSDYNLFDSGGRGGYPIIWSWSGDDPNYRLYEYSLDDSINIVRWRSDHGQDLHSSDSARFGKQAAFMNVTVDDYHLTLQSDAIDTGDDLSGQIDNLDKDKVRRPVADGWDIGAYEFVPLDRFVYLPLVLK